jgi:ketosteroid isomerase-like protein
VQSQATSLQMSEVDRDLLEQRIHTLLELRARGDVAGMLSYAAPDVVYKGGTWRSYPLHVTVVGKKACGELLRAVNVSYENLGSTINKLLIDGEKVAVHRTARIRNRGTGATVSIDICDFIRFQDGLIVEFSEFPDTTAAAQLESN